MAWTIAVKNQSGRAASYIVTTESPTVQDIEGDSWPMVIARVVQIPEGSTATFTIDPPRTWYAYALIAKGPLQHGTNTQVVSKIPITLGQKNPNNGRLEPGSTVLYKVPQGTPMLRPDTAPATGGEGCFDVVTGDDFSYDDAKKNGYSIGVGSQERPWGTMFASPGSKYIIKPEPVLFLAAYDIEVGKLIKSVSLGNTLKLDFASLGPEVNVIQGADGKLVFAK